MPHTVSRPVGAVAIPPGLEALWVALRLAGTKGTSQTGRLPTLCQRPLRTDATNRKGESPSNAETPLSRSQIEPHATRRRKPEGT